MTLLGEEDRGCSLVVRVEVGSLDRVVEPLSFRDDGAGWIGMLRPGWSSREEGWREDRGRNGAEGQKSEWMSGLSFEEEDA